MSAQLDAYETTGQSPGRPYLTAREVAAMLAVDDKTVFRWAATESTMPVLRIAGTVRFPRERLLRWLEGREKGRRQRAAAAAS